MTGVVAVLSASHRMRRSEEFAHTVRRGRRSGRATVVGYLAERRAMTGAVPAEADPARVGFVVGRAVGGAVVRNRVRRRLRHLMRADVARLPAGTLLVLRALPSAATASWDELTRDVDGVLRRLTSRREDRTAGVGR